MEALSEAMASKPPLGHDVEDTFTFAENDGDDLRFHKSCLEQIDRYRRTDEWLPSYHNILSRTALNATRTLLLAGVIDNNPASIVQYTRDGTADQLRLCAFENLIRMGLHKEDALLGWFLFAMGTDPSPVFRRQAFRLLGQLLGSIAIGQKASGLEALEQDGGLIIERDDASNLARKADLARRTTVPGALAALKSEVQDNETLKKGLWTAISSPALTLKEIKELLDICTLLYEPESSMRVILKYPRYWQCKKVGKGRLLFSQTEKVRTMPLPKRSLPPPPPPPLLLHPTTAAAAKAPLSRSPTLKREGSSASTTVTMPPPPPAQRRPLFKPPRRPSEGGEALSPAVPSPTAPTPTRMTPVEGEKPRLKIKLKIGPPKPAAG